MKKMFIFSFSLLISLYALKIYFSYSNFDFNLSFGYLDHQLYWQTLLDFTAGKALYKNIFWEYSLLPLLIRIPFFLILQKSFFASVLINQIILPVIGIVLSFYIGRQLLEKKALLLFGFLLLFMGTNSSYASIRYLIPELGLLMVIIAMETNDKRKLLIGSVIMGMSLLSSVEYAIASHLGLILYFLFVLVGRNKINKKQWMQLLVIETVIGSSFLVYLVSNNAFQNFIQFHLEYFKSFYTQGPCRELFPRMDVFDKFQVNPFGVLSHLNFYIVPLFLLSLGVWIFFTKNIRFKLAFVVLIGYSLLVSYRNITSPCYYSYGLTIPFVILSYLIFQANLSKFTRGVLISIAVWFIFSSSDFNPIKTIIDQPWQSAKQHEKEFLPGANIYLSKRLTKEYIAITRYIQTHTSRDEYVYTHRVGPYNELAHRRSPVSVSISSAYEMAPFLVNLTLDELKQNPPSYVIINTLNGDSYSNTIRNINSNVHIFGEKIIFEGDMTPVEDYISQNYMIDKIFDIAWVLKRRNKPIKLVPYYVPYNKPVTWSIGTKQLEQNISISDTVLDYKVTGNNPVLYFFAPELKMVEHIEIPIFIDLGGIKYFSKFISSVIFITQRKQIINTKDNLISSDWSDQWIYVPNNKMVPKGDEVVGVAIYVSDNFGFLPWGKPVSIKLNTPKLYIRNPKIGETIKGYKKNY